MPEYTPNLNLYLPGGGGSGTIPDEIADIDKLNENFRLIDASIGGSVVPAKAGYTNRFNGNLVFARNERKLFMESSADGGLLDISPGANFYKGTAAEREAFKGYAEDGDAWQDTDSTQMLYVKVGSNWNNGSSTTPTLASGWGATGAGEEPTISRSRDGMCVLTGRIVRNSGTIGAPFTISDDLYKPKKTTYGTVAAMGGAGADGTRFTVSLSVSGVLTLTAYTGGPAWTSSTWIPLNLHWISI